jgi:hypothetical protein
LVIFRQLDAGLIECIDAIEFAAEGGLEFEQLEECANVIFVHLGHGPAAIRTACLSECRFGSFGSGIRPSGLMTLLKKIVAK